ncbi:MAG TPA: phosphatase PAP2 family protein [Symbiobacteriaceae bacterium]|nr:phosphatase PAP2 family protein [Symbiobacteriaceae bacterium]
MDRLLFIWINGMAGQLPWLDSLMVALGRSVAPVVLPLCAALWWWPGPTRHERRIGVSLTVLAVLLALGAASVAGFIYYRPRPFKVIDTLLLVPRVPDASFPSTHTAVLSAVATVVPLPGRPWRAAVWLLVAGVMIGRVYVGVHYPSDVLGGLAFGWATGAAVWGNRDVLRAFAERVVGAVEECF